MPRLISSMSPFAVLLALAVRIAQLHVVDQQDLQALDAPRLRPDVGDGQAALVIDPQRQAIRGLDAVSDSVPTVVVIVLAGHER
jgi:hypothetical protein